VERGIGKLIGQEAKSGNVCGPPETRGDKLSEGDLERIARLRTLHVDWPGHGIDTAEVKRRHIGGSRAAFEMPVASIEAFEVNLAGLTSAPGEGAAQAKLWFCSGSHCDYATHMDILQVVSQEPLRLPGKRSESLYQFESNKAHGRIPDRGLTAA
jgi:hypothetical protein